MEYEFKIQVLADGRHRLTKAIPNTDTGVAPGGDIFLGDYGQYIEATQAMERVILGRKWFFDATGKLLNES